MPNEEESPTRVVNVRFTNELVDRTEDAVRKEGFRNRSELISYSVRKFLDSLSDKGSEKKD